MRLTYIGTPLPPSLIGMFDKVDMFCSLPRLTSKVAFKPGSSKQGNAFLAWVAWNWVVAISLKMFYPVYRCSNT